jgi:hypothetical protein
MLSFRMILFCLGAGICLWGLFNLLDNLKQPELLRAPKAIIVKGCEPAESAEAAVLCPQLYCQKALLDSKSLPLKTRFTVTTDRRDAATSTQLIAGTISGAAGEPAFACLMDGQRVIAARRLDMQALEPLQQQAGGWKL